MNDLVDSMDLYRQITQVKRPERVLEVGTKRSVETISTHHMEFFPGIARENYIMADVQAGVDVDIVCDIHHLPSDWADSFDAVYTQAVFEHLERPWIAAQEIYRVLRKGGICYTGTHQTYPIHGFPSDFFRFSKEALNLIFADAGFKIVSSGYRHRAKIIPSEDILDPGLVDAWNAGQESWIYVHNFTIKE